MTNRNAVRKSLEFFFIDIFHETCREQIYMEDRHNQGGSINNFCVETVVLNNVIVKYLKDTI